jgi:hypothetical protein
VAARPGAEPSASTPKEFSTVLKDRNRALGEVVKISGARAPVRPLSLPRPFPPRPIAAGQRLGEALPFGTGESSPLRATLQERPPRRLEESSMDLSSAEQLEIALVAHTETTTLGLPPRATGRRIVIASKRPTALGRRRLTLPSHRVKKSARRPWMLFICRGAERARLPVSRPPGGHASSLLAPPSGPSPARNPLPPLVGTIGLPSGVASGRKPAL